MKPYYSDNFVTIIHGDCRELLEVGEAADIVFTDPPYGVNGAQNTKTAQRRGGARKNDYGQFVDSVDYVRRVAVPVVEHFVKLGKRVVLTPGNRCVTLYPLPASFGAIIQPCSVGLQAWGRADAQPILYYGKSPNGGQGLAGTPCSYVVNEGAENNGHPCPKPYSFWSLLLSACSRPGELVFDPFMGSGTTLRAAKDLQRRAIGIEIDERYCEIAAERLTQETLDLGA